MAKAKQKKPLETSKKLLRDAGYIFAGHIILSAALIILGYGEHAVPLMSATSPVYLAVVVGYFGKAGVENVSKKASEMKHLTDELSEIPAQKQISSKG